MVNCVHTLAGCVSALPPRYPARHGGAQMSKSFKIGRDAKTGELKTVEYAREHPKTAVVEHMPKRGYGTAKK